MTLEINTHGERFGQMELSSVGQILQRGYETHPVYEQGLLVEMYADAYSQILSDLHLEGPDLPNRSILRDSNVRFLNELKGIRDELIDGNFDKAADKLEALSLPTEDVVAGKLHPEYMLIAIPFKEAVEPVLKSEARARDYKRNIQGFVEVVGDLITSFEHGRRGMFIFKAGELYEAAQMYQKGKGAGLANATLLRLRDFLRSI